MNDPILEEIYRYRDAQAAKFNYDLDDFFRDLKERELRSGRTYVSFAGPPNGVAEKYRPPSTIVVDEATADMPRLVIVRSNATDAKD